MGMEEVMGAHGVERDVLLHDHVAVALFVREGGDRRLGPFGQAGPARRRPPPTSRSPSTPTCRRPPIGNCSSARSCPRVINLDRD